MTFITCSEVLRTNKCLDDVWCVDIRCLRNVTQGGMKLIDDEFSHHFKDLTGNYPFPWQTALYREFVNNEVPLRCDIAAGGNG